MRNRLLVPNILIKTFVRSRFRLKKRKTVYREHAPWLYAHAPWPHVHAKVREFETYVYL